MFRSFILLNIFFIQFLGTHYLVAQEKLIPKTLGYESKNSWLDLSKGIKFSESTNLYPNEKKVAKSLFLDWNISTVDPKSTKKYPTIAFELSKKIFGSSNEAYTLIADKKGITIKANAEAGLFYGLQTLRQLILKSGKLKYTHIQDMPQFSWRAFLLDVGRNYQPVDMIKEQIDVMSQYKLNVLHFHFTEDLAWRLVSKKYPGLTDAKVMERWAGKYYTEEEFKSLIAYCKERHILFLPEIDMPGHSAAFKRYFGADMQSETGMRYIKELLKEFKDTYPELPYLHIGGDEVKITNKNFMPEITKYVESLGYTKTFGWDPGSNLSTQTVRQLWMGGPQKINEDSPSVYIDSKHLYINHMDPLETVTTIFHRKIGSEDREHAKMIGATLCVWPDRAVSAAKDMFYQNAVYPSLVTFAEKAWRGGGKDGWIANIVESHTQDYVEFSDFEDRLLVHKKRYFVNKPFPYVKQTGLRWELLGPYDNEGDLDKSFAVEQNPFDPSHKIYKTIEGGTVILRHWWADVVKGAVDNPKNHSTFYARTKIWSAVDEKKPFWIGFDNLSRSYASDSPDLGTWDGRKSWVKVNGDKIEPPQWKQAGMKGDLEKPLVDEGYSYREPTMISLKKGWNEVLIKLPLKDFNGKNWQTPVKWMFTFINIAEN